MTVENAEQRLLLADEAKRLLTDPLFNGVLNSITKDYIQELMKTKPGSEAGITAHASLNALDDIKKRLKAVENDGVMLRNELNKERKREA